MKQASIEDLYTERWLRQRERGEIVWTTRDGKTVPIKDMSDRHLENTINMLVRNEEAKDAYYEGLAGLADKDWAF